MANRVRRVFEKNITKESEKFKQYATNNGRTVNALTKDSVLDKIGERNKDNE